VSWLPSTADGRGAPGTDRRLNDAEGMRSAPNEDWLSASAAMSECAPVEHEATYPNAVPQLQSCDRGGHVSEQRHAPRPRRVDGRILVEALDLAGTLIALLDSAGRIVSLNRACERACGWSVEEVCGRVFWSCAFVVPNEVQAITHAVRAVAVERSCNRVEWMGAPGETIPAEASYPDAPVLKPTPGDNACRSPESEPSRGSYAPFLQGVQRIDRASHLAVGELLQLRLSILHNLPSPYRFCRSLL